jgi:hypothetical protein
MPSQPTVSRICKALGIGHLRAQERKVSRRRVNLPAQVAHFRANANRWPSERLVVMDETRVSCGAVPRYSLGIKGTAMYLTGDSKAPSATVVQAICWCVIGLSRHLALTRPAAAVRTAGRGFYLRS